MNTHPACVLHTYTHTTDRWKGQLLLLIHPGNKNRAGRRISSFPKPWEPYQPLAGAQSEPGDLFVLVPMSWHLGHLQATPAELTEIPSELDLSLMA